MNNELMKKIEALPDLEALYLYGYEDSAILPFGTDDLKRLAAELTLANKKLAILQASNDHYGDEKHWFYMDEPEPSEKYGYFPSGNGFDFARKAQEEIARLTEGEND